MKKFFYSALFLPILVAGQQSDSAIIRSFFNEALVNKTGYDKLTQLCTNFPKRLSGSPGATAAAKWMVEQFNSAGADTAWLQPVMVPHWERGANDAVTIWVDGVAQNFKCTALGGSVGTEAGGIKAEIIEVHSLKEVDTLKEKVKGKIVFYNGAMPQDVLTTFEAYGKTVGQRVWGASTAAKYGAVGMILRSVCTSIDDHPHTGVMIYKDSIPKIPAAAISTFGAEQLHQWISKKKKIEVTISLGCKNFPDELSYNAIGEIRGSEFPNSVIVIGGHLDAWDTGEGANDDGAGVMHSFEVLRLMKKLGIKPKHTIRVIAFMNEENGGMGGKEYAKWATTNGEIPLAAMESDGGAGVPRGFGFTTNDSLYKLMMTLQPLFEKFHCGEFKKGGGGSDIGPLEDSCHLIIGFNADSQRYFDLHHAETDVPENINPRELELGAAAMTGLIWEIDKILH